MIIYSNGCSHTHNHCVEKHEIWSTLVMNRFTENYYLHIADTHHFHVEYTQNKNILVNDSRRGAGNDYILHSSVENITYLIKNNLKPDYVFIQWSGPNRRQYCEPDGTIVFVNPYSNVHYGLKFEPMGSIHTLHYMYLLQKFIESHNIEYRFFNYIGLDNSIFKNEVFDVLNKKKILDFGIGDDIFTKGLLGFIKERNTGLICDDQGHFNAGGHEFITKHIIKTL